MNKFALTKKEMKKFLLKCEWDPNKNKKEYVAELMLKGAEKMKYVIAGIKREINKLEREASFMKSSIPTFIARFPYYDVCPDCGNLMKSFTRKASHYVDEYGKRCINSGCLNFIEGK